MTFTKAQEEFAVRYYLWAREESRLEIERGFPLLKRMDTSICRRYLRQIAQLSPQDQHAFATMLIKRFHPQVIRLLGEEALSSEEVATIKRYTRGHVIELDPVEEAFFQRQIRADPTTKLDRKRFRKIIKESLAPILGQGEKDDGGGTWHYITNIENIRIVTHVDTGGKHDQLSYFHRIIFSGYQALHEQISVLDWMGLSSATHWRQLDDSKAEVTARFLAELCDHFLKVAPKLLKGINLANT